MVRIGIAGIGFMGVTHYKAAGQVPDAQVKAIFTRSEKKLEGDWSQVQGNFGEAGGVQDLSGVTKHRSFEALIGDDDLDLIDICLPTSLHAPYAIKALEAGKHVLVEKPIALSVSDADRMIAAAEASCRQLMVAQVLRFYPSWMYLKDVAESGRFGPLLTLNQQRVISRPDWSRDIADFSANGGPLIDLHIHDVDFMLYLLGKPKRVAAIGRRQGNAVVYVSTIYDYGNGPSVSCQSGAVVMSGRPFLHGFEACFERATVTFAQATEPVENESTAGRSASHVLSVYDVEGGVSFPDLPVSDSFVAQLKNVVQCVSQDKPSQIIGAVSARDSLALVHLEDEAIRQGGYVEVV